MTRTECTEPIPSAHGLGRGQANRLVAGSRRCHLPGMRKGPCIALVVGAGLLWLAGCSSLLLGARPSAPDVAPTSLQADGITRSSGSLRSATGCRLDYRLYAPARSDRRANQDALVVLGHGFLRSQERMAGLAEAIAEAGIPAATLDFCNMRFWDGRHQQNGLDMIAVAAHLGAQLEVERVVYSGFSAGALAALVAARNDPRALGAVTLDLVDTQGIGQRAVANLDKPVLGLAGEATNCNARDNGRAVFAASPATTLQRIPGAGHCDFEAPTDGLCELVCDDPDAAGASATAALRGHILARATAAIVALVERQPTRWSQARAGPALG